MSEDPIRARRHLGGELIIPVLAVAFTIYFLSTIIDSPWTAQVSAVLIGGTLLVLCLIFFVRAAIELARGDAGLGFGNLFSREDITTGRVGLFLATIGFCWFIGDFGFTITTFLFLAISMIVLSHFKRVGLILTISAIMALAGWAVFILAFDTRFPRGLFETFMAGVLHHG